MLHPADASSFAMEGPMVALLMPFKPDSLDIDDASFIKYLNVMLSVHGMSPMHCSPVATRGAQPTVQHKAWCSKTFVCYFCSIYGKAALRTLWLMGNFPGCQYCAAMQSLHSLVIHQ